MSSKEYLALDGDEGEAIKKEDENGTSIELDVNLLSIQKIRFLQNFIDNQRNNQQVPENECMNTETYQQQQLKAQQEVEEQAQNFQQV